MLVIDANVAVAACAKEEGFAELGDETGLSPARRISRSVLSLFEPIRSPASLRRS
jgi:hypothetical protein